jgi:FkbM family methyltransferase
LASDYCPRCWADQPPHRIGETELSQEAKATERVNFVRVKHVLVWLQNKLMFILVLYKNRGELGSLKLVRLGSAYGGWWIPTEVEKDLRVKALVSAGLGFDTSFDEAMLEKGWSVLGIDPLSECCALAQERLSKYPKFQVLNVGLSVEDGYQTFFQPKNPNHDSWSTINAQSVDNPLSVDFPVISLKGLIGRHEILVEAGYRYLKMDIEGAELALFQESMADFAGFDFLAVELDFLSPIPFLEIRLRIRRIRYMRKILRQLKREGWNLVHVENSNFFWEKSTQVVVA